MSDRSAPGALALVQDFLNTADLEGGADELSSPAALEEWFRARGVPLSRPTRVDLDRARAFRERVRDAISHEDERATADVASALAEVTGSAPLKVVFDASGVPHLEPAGAGVDAAIGAILAAIVEADREGTWARLKACRSDSCRWAFYDRSRNASSSWCSMRSCGNRAKARRFRERHGPATKDAV